jgi:signal peptidase I
MPSSLIDPEQEKAIGSDQFTGLAAEILASGSTLRFRARGGSMRPFIQDGDLLEIQPLLDRPVRVGDILLFRYGQHPLLVHRVVQIAPPSSRDPSPGFITQGDAVLRPDGCIPTQAVLGRVASIERRGRLRRLDTPFQIQLAAWIVLSLKLYKFFRNTLPRPASHP